MMIGVSLMSSHLAGATEVPVPFTVQGLAPCLGLPALPHNLQLTLQLLTEQSALNVFLHWNYFTFEGPVVVS